MGTGSKGACSQKYSAIALATLCASAALTGCPGSKPSPPTSDPTGSGGPTGATAPATPLPSLPSEDDLFISSQSLGYLIVALDPHSSPEHSHIQIGFLIAKKGEHVNWMGFRQDEFVPNDYPSMAEKLYVFPITTKDEFSRIQQGMTNAAKTFKAWHWSNDGGNGTTGGTTAAFVHNLLESIGALSHRGEDAGAMDRHRRSLSKESNLESCLLGHYWAPPPIILRTEADSIVKSRSIQDATLAEHVERWRKVLLDWDLRSQKH